MTDTARPRRIINAPGATVTGNTASWTIPALAAGRRAVHREFATTTQPGPLLQQRFGQSARALDNAGLHGLEGVPGILVVCG